MTKVQLRSMIVFRFMTPGSQKYSYRKFIYLAVGIEKTYGLISCVNDYERNTERGLE